MRHDRIEEHDAGRKVRSDNDAPARFVYRRAYCRLMLGPAGGSDHEIDAAPRERRGVPRHRRGRGEIDRHVDAVPARSVGAAAMRRRLRIDHACHFKAVLGGERLDHPSHFAVADQ